LALEVFRAMNLPFDLFALDASASGLNKKQTETALREWVHRARADRTKGKTGLTTVEREELVRLRRENRVLQEERDILKKAAAFFAKHQR